MFFYLLVGTFKVLNMSNSLFGRRLVYFIKTAKYNCVRYVIYLQNIGYALNGVKLHATEMLKTVT